MVLLKASPDALLRGRRFRHFLSLDKLFLLNLFFGSLNERIPMIVLSLRHVQLLKVACILALLLICACQPKSSSDSNSPSSLGNQISRPPVEASPPNVDSPLTPDPVDPVVVPPAFAFESLVWESASRVQAKNWSTYLFNLISTDAKALLSAQDFPQFCPTYSSLSEKQKINVAGQLVAAITKYESGYNPLSRYHESTMGTDPVTGLPVYSEGLLQLSYQDAQWASFCPFDWSADQYLSETDPQKTILDPYKNLYCGVRILANQVQKKGLIILGSGAYWAVIKSNSAYQKLDEIKAIVRTLSFCK